MDGLAFACFTNRAPNVTVTVTWAACAEMDPAHGNVLRGPDEKRCALLRDALWRALRREGLSWVCAWARAYGSGNGEHLHLSLWWPLPAEKLVALLTRLTGVGPKAGRLKRGYLARADGGGWLIQENTDPFVRRGVVGGGAYLLRQEREHPLTLTMAGKLVDVSRDISATAIASHRQELEAWKRDVGWHQLVQERMA